MLRRRALLIVLCVVLAAGAAYGFSKHQTKQYTATASLVFNNNQLGQQLAGLPAASSSNQQAQQNTNLKLVQIGDMAAKTAALLGQGLTEEAVSANVSVSAQGESNIVEVAATSTSPSAGGRYREHLHHPVRQGAAEQQPPVLQLRPGAREQAAGGAVSAPARRHRRAWRWRTARSRWGCSPNCARAASRSRRSRRSPPPRPRRRSRGTRSSARSWVCCSASASPSCSSASTAASGSRRIWRPSTAFRCWASSPRARRSRAPGGRSGQGVGACPPTRPRSSI